MEEQCIQSVAVEVPLGERTLVVFWLEGRETERGIRISPDKLRVTGQETRDGMPLPSNTVVFVFVAWVLLAICRAATVDRLTPPAMDHPSCRRRHQSMRRLPMHIRFCSISRCRCYVSPVFWLSLCGSLRWGDPSQGHVEMAAIDCDQP